MIGGLPLHLLCPPLQERTEPSPTELVAAALEGALARSAPSLVVAPAGLATVEHEDEALRLAEALRTIARRTGTVLVFGIDVGPPQPGAGRLFACYGGAPVMWPATAGRGFPPRAEARVLTLGGARVLPLFAPEALDPTAPRRVAALGGVDAILVLSHGGATARWATRLARLERVAPVAVATHHGGAGRGYASPSLAVSWLAIGVNSPPVAVAA